MKPQRARIHLVIIYGCECVKTAVDEEKAVDGQQNGSHRSRGRGGETVAETGFVGCPGAVKQRKDMQRFSGGRDILRFILERGGEQIVQEKR